MHISISSYRQRPIKDKEGEVMNTSGILRTGLLSVAACSLIFTLGCHTSAQFKTPNDTQLYINNRPVMVEANSGRVVTRPFFWSASAGIPYQLMKDGSVVQSGKLSSGFRIVSIFWPPYAFIYWPIGFDSPVYDLTNDPSATKHTP